MKRVLLLLILIYLGKNSTLARDGSFLSPQERAYLFHVVKKSATLDRNIGHLFFYKGDTPRYNTRIDYDSIEKLIILEPSILEINMTELSKMPPGILAEAAMKIALWKLNKRLKKSEKAQNPDEFHVSLREHVFQNAPESVLRKKGGGFELIPEIDPIFDPSLPAGYKLGVLRSIKGMSIRDMEVLMHAYTEAVNQLAEQESRRLFIALGGRYGRMNSALVAAGEGSSTAGLLDEVEKDEKGRPDKKQPVGVGLFTYQYEKGINEAEKFDLLVKRDPIIGFEDYLGGSSTTLHLSIWGFNNFFQATVVVRNGEKSYLLFGNKWSNELSPDTTFGHGRTVFKQLEELQEVIDKELFLIDKPGGLKEQWNKAKQIEKLAFERVRESEYALRRVNFMEDRKKYKEAQAAFIDWSQRYEMARKETIERHTAYKKQWFYVDYLKDKHYQLRTDLGPKIQQYEQRDSLFIFEDGSTFNLHTQDFELAKINRTGSFSVRLISLGSKPLSQNVDEVQLYVGVHEKIEKERLDIRFEANDVFRPDEFMPVYTHSFDDMKTLADFIANNQPTIYFSMDGHGIGMKQGDHITKATGKAAKELSAYPGKGSAQQEVSRNSEAFKPLRSSFIKVRNTFGLTIEIESFTDPVASGILNDSTIDSLHTVYPKLTANEMLSAFRCFAIAEGMTQALREKILQSSSDDLKGKTNAIMRIEEAFENSVTRCGDYALPYQTYMHATRRYTSSSGNPNK